MPSDVPKTPDGKPQFYGRRRTHKLRPGRERLVEERLPELRIADANGTEKISLADAFGRTGRAHWLEIGFGAGEHLLGVAEANPDIDFIGCEPFINGVAALLSDIDRRGIGNVRLFDDDVRLLLARLPEASFEGVFILFPDPWPKSRHHRRRLVQRSLLDELARLCVPGADLIFASDHMGYVASVLYEVRSHDDWSWTAQTAADWRVPPEGWIPTRYETKALAKNDRPAYLRFTRAT